MLFEGFCCRGGEFHSLLPNSRRSHRREGTFKHWPAGTGAGTNKSIVAVAAAYMANWNYPELADSFSLRH